MKRVRLLSTILVLCFAISAVFLVSAVSPSTVYVSPEGSDSAAGDEDHPLKTLSAAYANVADGGSIVLQGSIELPTKLVFDQGKQVTLNGQGHTITYTGGATISPDQYGLFTVTSGHVELADLTLKMPDIPSVNGRLLYVGSDAAVTLSRDTALKNGYLGYGGGGVLVDGGAFTMEEGSSIQNCYVANNTTAYGGGVLVKSGVFTMSGGEISNNTIHTTRSYKSYGGGVAILGGTFSMSGGTISGNQTDTAGGGVYLAEDGHMEVSGEASITGNVVASFPNNLFLSTSQTAFTQTAAVTGSIGIVHGDPNYGVAVGVPGLIAVADENAYSYDTGAYDVRLKDGKLVLYPWTVAVHLSGSGFQSDFTEDETPRGADFSLVLTPEDGFVLPDAVDITVGGVTLEDGYTYDPSSGELLVSGEKVTGDLSITAAPKALHTITVTLTNGISDVGETTVTEADTVQIVLSAAPRYALPETVTITGPCEHSYDPATGQLTLSHVTGDVTVSAQGAEIPHTIHLDPAGGELDQEDVVLNESQLTIGPLPIPTLEGYTFLGWFTQSGSAVDASTANHLTDDLFLTARWSANTGIPYQVQHWVELVDSGVNPGYTVGETPTREWAYGGQAHRYYLYTTSQYQDGVADGQRDISSLQLRNMEGLDLAGFTPNGGNIYQVTVAPDGSSVFPLYYDRSRYTLTFDGNGGTAAQDTAQVVYGSILGILPRAARAGYTLEGWYTSPHGGTQMTPEAPFAVSGDLTLYAHWQTTGDTPYTVTHMVQTLRDNLVGFDKGKDYAVYQVDAFAGDADTTVDVYALALTGFTPREDNPYQVNILSDGSGNVTLYYDRLKTTLAYDPAGGSLAAPAGSIVYFGGTVSALPAAPSRVGYALAGWYTGPAETDLQVTAGAPVSVIDPEGGKAVTLYAHWIPKTYELSFKTHGGTLAGGKRVTYGQEVGQLPVPSLTGYIFRGWYDQDGHLGQPEGNHVTEDTLVTAETLIAAQDGQETVKTLYAWYEPVTVTLAFDASPGTAQPDSIAATYDRPLGILPTATRPGFTLRSWRLGSLDGEILTPETVSQLTQDAVAYGEFAPNVYLVTLDPNGGTGVGTQLPVTYGQLFAGLSTPTRAGYTFQGWFDQESQEVKEDDTVSILTPTTLTAQWTANSYRLTLDPRGGILPDEVGQMTVTFDAPYGELPTPTRTGYNFRGWFTSQDGGDRTTGEAVMATPRDHTLYAQWFFLAAPKPSSSTVTGSIGGNGVGDSVSGTHRAYITGYVDGTFRPEGQLARCEAAAIFARISKGFDAAKAYPTSFPDVSAGVWYENYLGYCVSAGIITGWSDGLFHPMEPITRAEFAAMAARFAAKGKNTTSQVSFTDIQGHWAETYIRQGASLGWVQGDGQGHFFPDRSMTRSEAVSLINAALGRKPQAIPQDVPTFSDCADPATWYFADVQEAAHTHQFTQANSTAPERWTGWDKKGADDYAR